MLFLVLFVAGCVKITNPVVPLLMQSKTNSSTTIQIPVLEDEATYNFWTAGQYGPSVAPVYTKSIWLYDRGFKSYGWFKFCLSAIPEGSIIHSATFNGYVTFHHDMYGGYEVGSYYVYDDSWHEALYFGDPNAITWNTQPTNYDPNCTDSIIPTECPGWYSWDITRAVRDSYQNDGILSVLIRFVQDTYPDLISDPYNYGEAAGIAFPSGLNTNCYLLIEYTMPLEVAIDVKPESCPNPLNTKSKGVTPVAILGTADFDVTLIDLETVALAGVSPLQWNWEDVATPFEPYTGKEDCDLDCNTEGPDGYLDLTLKFDTQELLDAIGNVEVFEVSEEELNALESGESNQVTTTSGEILVDGACLVIQLEGNFLDGTAIIGEDVVSILKKGNK